MSHTHTHDICEEQSTSLFDVCAKELYFALLSIPPSPFCTKLISWVRLIGSRFPSKFKSLEAKGVRRGPHDLLFFRAINNSVSNFFPGENGTFSVSTLSAMSDKKGK